MRLVLTGLGVLIGLAIAARQGSTASRVLWGLAGGAAAVAAAALGLRFLPIVEREKLPHKLRFFPDVTASPLWEAGRGGANIPLEYTPLSAELKGRLVGWARWYDETMMSNDYEWPDDESWQAFVTEGARLCEHVSEELGPTFDVRYEVTG